MSTLHLIHGGLETSYLLHAKELDVIPLEHDLPRVDVMVREEDTSRVLGPDTLLSEAHNLQQEYVEELEQQAVNSVNVSHVPGSVLVLRQNPCVLAAIVYDLEKEPIWDEHWVNRALEKIFGFCELNSAHSLLLPLLGNTHGSLTIQRFVHLLDEVIGRMYLPSLTKIHLISPGADLAELHRELLGIAPRYPVE